MSTRTLALVMVTGVALGGPPGLAGQEPEPIVAGRAPATDGPYAPGWDARHYDIQLVIAGIDAPIRGRTQVRLVRTASSSAGAGLLPLDFTGLEVLSVEVGGRPTESTLNGGVLSVPVDTDADTVEVAVLYRGTPDDGLILGRNLHGEPTAFVDNWPNRARFWFPSIDHPSDKATAAFTVHAPASWRVIANGREDEAARPSTADELRALGAEGARATSLVRTRWATDVPIPTYTMVVGGANFAVEPVGLSACGLAPASPRPDGCVEVSWWVFPQDTAHARVVFGRSADMVDFFTRTIGPYPYEKLAHVQSSTRFGGMENASAIFYSERAIAERRDIEGTVSHEVAHQWFGDSVTETEWSHLWLSEGFATYFGHLFFEEADGIEVFRERMRGARLSVLASEASSRPVLEGRDDLFELLNSNNYPKGGWFLHMLRRRLGDEVFFRGIRSYYERYVNGNALTDDFRGVMEEASGAALGDFFAQWLERPGFPRFEVAWTEAPGSGAGPPEIEITLRQTQPPEWPTYRVPVTLQLEGSGVTERHTVDVEARTTTVRLPSPGGLERLVPDPDVWLLADFVVLGPASRER